MYAIKICILSFLRMISFRKYIRSTEVYLRSGEVSQSCCVSLGMIPMVMNRVANGFILQCLTSLTTHFCVCYFIWWGENVVQGDANSTDIDWKIVDNYYTPTCLSGVVFDIEIYALIN